MRRFLYAALVGFLKVVTRVFFRTIEVVGEEHVPAHGAVIFAGNHPNSLMDPVLITTTCGREVHFAAKDTLFDSAFLKPFLWILGSVPIRRRMDHKDGALDNASAFEALFEVLKHGDAFGIFPEGISHAMAELAPLKTGAARIALGAASAGTDVRIIPTGLNFRRRDRMRGRVLIQFGAPIVITKAMVDGFASDPKHAAYELTAEIDRALRAQTINAKDFEQLRVLDAVRRLYVPDGVDLALAEHAELTRRFVESWERLHEKSDIAEFFSDVESYVATLRALEISDGALTRGVFAADALLHVLRQATLLLIYFPLAIPGAILHAPVLLIAVVAGKFTERTDVIATTKMLVTAFGTLLAYACAVAWVFHSHSYPDNWIGALATLLVLPLSGWATIRVLERQSTLRSGFSTLLSLFRLQEELVRLRAVRDELRRRLLGLVDAHTPSGLARVVARDEHGIVDGDV